MLQTSEMICAGDARRGRVKFGADADLTIFDAEKIIDRATFPAPTTPTAGIPYVMVGGVPVVDQGETVTTAFPGRGVRSRV